MDRNKSMKKSVVCAVAVAFVALAFSGMTTAMPVATDASDMAGLTAVSICIYNEDGTMDQKMVSVPTDDIEDIKDGLMMSEDPLSVLVRYDVISEEMADEWATDCRKDTNFSGLFDFLHMPIVWGLDSEITAVSILGGSVSRDGPFVTKIAQMFDEDIGNISIYERSFGILGYTRIVNEQATNTLLGLNIVNMMFGYTGMHVSIPAVFDFYQGHALFTFSAGMALAGTAQPLLPSME